MTKSADQLRSERVVVLLTKNQKSLLRRICYMENVSCSTTIQELVEEYLKEYVDGK
jgi:hypothetical protein